MDPPDPDPGATVELDLNELRDQLPATREALRDQLPGLEPERHVTDWGRSERVEGIIDRTVYGFLYHYWFRVEVEGIDNVPSEGGALLVANHAGALPGDGAMIAKAIQQRHPRARPVHFATERDFRGLPLLGMLVTKAGGVSAHPANLHRLLFDERQLVLAFPEGRAATRKPINERYRLRSFRRDLFMEPAMRAGVPIVPVAVLGAEEAVPVLARIGPLSRLTRLPRVPVMPVVPLPAKFRIRFLEPVYVAPSADKALVRATGDDIRALLQENLLEMVAERRSVWLG